MGKWNDTDVPIAYLITFRTYGTWLHGDVRGSVDKAHNKFGGERAESSVLREQQSAIKLKGEPVVLNAIQSRLIEATIREVCVFRGWKLYAINVRTNHIHVVVYARVAADRVLNVFKAYATRRLRENGAWLEKHSPWVDKGSKRNLWNADHLFHACEYVVNGQGGELPEFD
jgi:REP element-mobilizing transposase RayT